ncbi:MULTISPECIES: DedA family protein [Oerskovia]|uniref:DedA family protein n=1 Tax=Oerskovia paurometabola TaxID=162170 RepID=A0ABW1XA54_9CELL|nr:MULTISPECIES: DedA family protein [Oerskovia]MBM7497851.1 membrane protein DedA with SNARE-associated domain [Oerskovia paurometabola]
MSVLLLLGPTASLTSAPSLARGVEVVTAADGSTGIFTIDGVPYWIIYAAAFAIVFVRAQATYWVGRGVARGTGNTRWARRLESERAQRAIATINKWGPIAVTLSFFTVGVQTVINLTAGYTRMRLPRYLAALLPGCAIWAAIWTTIGIAAFNTAVLLAAGSPVGLVVLVLLVAGLVAWVVVASRRRRSRAARDDDATLATSSGNDAPARTEATDGPPRTTGSNPFGDVADLLLDAPDDGPGPTQARRTRSDPADPSAEPAEPERD